MVVHVHVVMHMHVVMHVMMVMAPVSMMMSVMRAMMMTHGHLGPRRIGNRLHGHLGDRRSPDEPRDGERRDGNACKLHFVSLVR